MDSPDHPPRPLRPRGLALAPVLALVAGAVVAGLPGPARADEKITFEQAIGLADKAPRVEGAQAAARTKREADRAISRVPMNPQITLQPGYRVLQQEAREPEVVAEVVQPLSLSGWGGARLAAAAEEERALDEVARLQAVAQRLSAARAWLDLWAAQRVLVEVQREEQIAAELSRLVERAAQVAAATRADVADAKGFHAEARLMVIAAEGEVHDLGLVLAREAGLLVRGPLQAAGDLPSLPLPPRPEWEARLEHIEKLPSVRLAALRLRVEQAREVEEKAARGHVLQIGGGIQRDAPGGLVVNGIARLIPAWADRGERERAVLQAEAARLSGEARDARISATVDLLTAFHEVEHTGELLAELSERLVPAVRDAAELRARIYQGGEATLPEVLQARRIELMAVSRLQRALGAHAWAQAKLALLLATLDDKPLARSSDTPPGKAP